MNGGEGYLDKNGKLYDDGECVVFPSKEMRDWRKFSWKKGDVLVYRNCEEFYYTIFEGFQDDEYTQFKSRYCNNSENRWLQSKVGITDLFTKVSDEEAKRFIKKIEECYNDKLDIDTLEIEKAQPEFKDGDIITFKDRIIIIYNTSIEKSPTRTGIYYHACLKEGKLTINEYLISCGFGEGWYSSTEEEKHQLFDALAKEGKAWDAEKKQIVDLKPKVDELKPFDKVLVKDNPYGSWEPALFWKKVDVKDLHPYMIIGGKRYRYCEPYEGNECLLDNK